MNVKFIWGPGGAGKSHLAISKVCRIRAPSLLMTTDPSRRVLSLLNIGNSAAASEVNLGSFKFSVQEIEANRLFDQLAEVRPTNSKVRALFEQLVRGLQDFREYLILIQLSDEIRKQRFESIVIDTPPLQEAIGLHRAIFHLRAFFGQSLVQWALQSSQWSLVHFSLKKVFEITRIFIGKKTAEDLFEFIDFLAQHAERFQTASAYLEELVYSKNTEHIFITTPETPIETLKFIQSFFLKMPNIHFIVNRSVAMFSEMRGSDSFSAEIRGLKTKEDLLVDGIQKNYPGAKMSRIPLFLMGDDTESELLKFIEKDPSE